MKNVIAVLLAFGMLVISVAGQAVTNGSSDEIVAMEKSWGEKIKARDVAAMDNFLAPSYFLAIGVKGQPIRVVPRAAWLESLPLYVTESFSIDDIKVNMYGNVAVALMMYTQKAAVGKDSLDRSAQFVITDIWTRTGKGWRIAERHSSRPETPK